jgi:glutamate-1-semialdehyde 2,1-aminomutase
MAAGIATLTQLMEPGFYETLDEKTDHLATGLEKAAENAGIDVMGARIGSMLGLFFNEKSVLNFDDAKASDLKMFSAFYNGMLQKGVYIAPSQFEVLFVSAAHDREHIDATIKAAEEVMDGLKHS